MPHELLSGSRGNASLGKIRRGAVSQSVYVNRSALSVALRNPGERAVSVEYLHEFSRYREHASAFGCLAAFGSPRPKLLILS